MTVDGEKLSSTITTSSLQLRSLVTDSVFKPYRITNRSTPQSVTTLPVLCDRTVVRRLRSVSQILHEIIDRIPHLTVLQGCCVN